MTERGCILSFRMSGDVGVQGGANMTVFLVRLSSNFQERLLMQSSSSLPQFILGLSLFIEGVVSVFGGAYPAGFGSLKAVMNCFWPRKVGHMHQWSFCA